MDVVGESLYRTMIKCCSKRYPISVDTEARLESRFPTVFSINMGTFPTTEIRWSAGRALAVSRRKGKTWPLLFAIGGERENEQEESNRTKVDCSAPYPYSSSTPTYTDKSRSTSIPPSDRDSATI